MMGVRKTFLVTGANGFVGSSLCRFLLDQGQHVVRLLRKPQTHLQGAKDIVIENWEHAGFENVFQGVDVLVHLAARVHMLQDNSSDPLAEYRKTNVLITENLARAAANAGVPRFIYLSSIKVNGEGSLKNLALTYNEDVLKKPEDPYGVSKWEAERSLLDIANESSLEVTIIRPPLVYGPGVRANFLKLIKTVDKGLPLPLKSLNNARSLVYVDNLVSSIYWLSHQPQAKNQVYLVSDGTAFSTSELIAQISACLGKKAALFYFPPKIMIWAGKLLHKESVLERLLGSLKLDISKIQKLGWKPPVPVRVGLENTVQWYLENNKK